MTSKNKNESKKLTLPIVIVLNLLVLSSLFVFAFYYSNITNTLKHNGNWESHKTLLEKKVMGANATLETHRALAGNQLDLGVWHGNQELFLKDSIQFDRLNFKAKLIDSSHFCFFYHKNGDTLSGIRLSANPTYPSMIFEVLDGKFIDKKLIPFLTKKEKWIKIKLENYGSQYNLIVNEEPIYASNSNLTFNTFGLRGTERSTLIDNIELSTNKDGVVFKDRFKKPMFPPLIIALFIVGIVLFNFVLYLLRAKINWLISLVVFGLLLTVGLGIYHQFYKQYRYNQPKRLIKILPAKKTEKDSTKIYKKKKSKNEIRILFIGSSQTWGAGASTEENTFVKRFETKLNARQSDTTFVCINASVSGQQSTEMLNYYRYLRPELSPDFVIINLSYNDAHNLQTVRHFSKNIQAFIDINKEFEIPTILIPEPLNPNYSNLDLNNRVLANQNAIDSIGSVNNVPVISMQPFVNKHFDDGFLFWDIVHLSDYGQLLFAEELYRKFILIQ